MITLVMINANLHALCHEMEIGKVQQQNNVMLATIYCRWQVVCLSAVGLACLALPREEVLRLKKSVKMQNE